MPKRRNKKPLWGGRFRELPSRELMEFSSSIDIDSFLFKEDIEGSIAHVEMLSSRGIIPQEKAERIRKALEEIKSEMETGRLKPLGEDIHMFIEERLFEKIGEDAGYLHTARSRNDQVAFDEVVFVKRAYAKIKEQIKEVIESLIELAERYATFPFPFYTHLQVGHLVSLGHHFLAHAWAFLRDYKRAVFFESLLRSPLGSTAGSSTSLPIDRKETASRFSLLPVDNSIDGVSSRDHIMDMLYLASSVLLHVSRIAEEFVLWSSWEFSFIKLNDRYSTGSSILPHKKNPDIPELLRGKVASALADLVGIMTLQKALPLAYNRDLQDDKKFLKDAYKELNSSLKILALFLKEGFSINEEKIRNHIESFPYLYALDLVEYLVAKGVPLRRAHRIVGQVVAYCEEKDKSLKELSLSEYRKFAKEFGEDIFTLFSPETSIKKRAALGGPGEIREQIKRLKEELK